MKVIQPRELNVRKTVFVGSVILALIVWNVLRRPEPPVNPSWHGTTMGTTYTVSLAHSPLSWKALADLRDNIDGYLTTLDASLSTYIDDSDVSRFNRSDSMAPTPVSVPCAELVGHAIELWQMTGGAYDPTVGPLVSLWGFGPHERKEPPPSTEEIQQARARLACPYLAVTDDHHLLKGVAHLELDLNAVAKGYAAQQVARMAVTAGASNVYVEVGGDCAAYGRNAKGEAWRIGIELPRYGAGVGEAVEAVVPVSGRALATSGDYRIYRRDEKGKVISHIIDPRTGQPVSHRLASVSVLCDNGWLADGLATALFVMGADEGLTWLAAHPGIEALFLVRADDGTFTERRTPGFETIALDEPTPSR